MSSNYVFCPVNVLTYVSNQPAPFAHVHFWSRDSDVEVYWERTSDGVPFHFQETTTLRQGDNLKAVFPGLANVWWFKPLSGDAYIRLT